ncbi:unnamed protein product [Owenia fusiformis]|uniref:Uncharacterized protein n=1 Tax=Owenia fusiformis TaxID=6347 RepID=A0A8J1XM88_OWEFU|nr:unnamed protein product [Owenia fusiformis]
MKKIYIFGNITDLRMKHHITMSRFTTTSMMNAVPTCIFMTLTLFIGITEGQTYSDCGSPTHVPVDTSSVKTVTSYNHPSNYLSSQSCTYLIVAPETSSIQLNFTAFHLEASGTCSYDSLTIYDGQTTAYPLLGRYCGLSLPSDVISSSNYLTLSFSTDGSVTASGFSADVMANQPGSASTIRGECGSMLPVFALSDASQNLYSLNYPDPYPVYQDCSWLVMTADTSKVIMLTLQGMDIESTLSCSNDVLKVHDGDTIYRSTLKSWCGQLSNLTASDRSVVTTGNSATVRFTTNGFNSGAGFNLSYVYTDPPPTTTTTTPAPSTLPAGTYSACTGGSYFDALSENQTIYSPGYPLQYGSDLECRYILTAADPGSYVRVAIEYIDLEVTSTCSYDYLAFRSGDDFSAPMLLKTCQGTTSGPDTWPASTGRSMAVSFITDGSVTNTGFLLKFWQVPNPLAATAISPSGVVTRYAYEKINGTLYSPNWINGVYLTSYANDIDVSWIITAFDEDNIVKIYAIDFSLQSSDFYGSCLTYDYVEFRDGDQAFSTLIDRWCGSRIGYSLQTTGRSLHIRMKTDSYDVYSGFKINYWTVLKSKPEETDGFKLSGGAIAGIVVPIVFLVIIIQVCCRCMKKKKQSANITPTPGNADKNRTPPAPPKPTPSKHAPSLPPPYGSVIVSPMRPQAPRPPPPPAPNQFGPPPPNQFGPPPGPFPPPGPRFMPPPSAPQAPPVYPPNAPTYPPTNTPMYPPQRPSTYPLNGPANDPVYPPPPHDPRVPPSQPPPSYANFAKSGPSQGIYSIQTDMKDVPEALPYNTGQGYNLPSAPYGPPGQSGVYYDNVNAGGEDDPDAPPAVALPAGVGKLDPITEAEISKHEKRERKKKLKKAQNKLNVMSTFRDSISDNHLKM